MNTIKTLLLASLVRAARLVGETLLALVVLGYVVDHCGSTSGEVVIHVMEPDVHVTVGERGCDVEGRNPQTLVYDLPFGTYELAMTRGGRVLYRESFELQVGESRVLTAWDSGRSHPSHEGLPAVGYVAVRPDEPSR